MAYKFNAENSVTVIQLAGITSGATLGAGYPLRRAIHCNVDGTYRIYDANGVSTDRVLLAGLLYPFGSTKITTTVPGNVNDGDVVAEA